MAEKSTIVLGDIVAQWRIRRAQKALDGMTPARGGRGKLSVYSGSDSSRGARKKKQTNCQGIRHSPTPIPIATQTLALPT